MALRKKINTVLTVFVLFLAINNVAMPFSEDYSIKKNNEKIQIFFSLNWAFDQLKLPVISKKLWGNSRKCLAATLQIGEKHFVSSVASNSEYLIFEIPGISSNSLVITPILFCESEKDSQKDLEFTAVPAPVRQIENELTQRIDETLLFQQQNNCFSCHTALPLAVACKTAASKGYNIDQKKS